MNRPRIFCMLYLFILLFFTSCRVTSSEIVTDIDGNVYKTVTIGKQVWMGENLRVTRYTNGDSVKCIYGYNEWTSSDYGAYCSYKSDVNNGRSFGYLYNWYAVSDQRKLAPKGWHIPTIDEVNELVCFLGGDTVAGKSLKDVNGWMITSDKANNSSLFSAQPGGYRYGINGTYHTLGSNGYWWTQRQSFELFAHSTRIYNCFANVLRNESDKTLGLSVRCVKDKEP